MITVCSAMSAQTVSSEIILRTGRVNRGMGRSPRMTVWTALDHGAIFLELIFSVCQKWVNSTARERSMTPRSRLLVPAS